MGLSLSLLVLCLQSKVKRLAKSEEGEDLELDKQFHEAKHVHQTEKDSPQVEVESSKTVADSSLAIPYQDVQLTRDWKLNKLLLKIAQCMEDTHLEQVKFLLTGDGGVPQGYLSKFDTPLKLFTCLKQSRMISNHNTLLLQAILKDIHREDLYMKACEWAKNLGDSLYFYEPRQEERVNGYKHVQFHVKGRAEDFMRSNLEAIKKNVSDLLDVKPEFVFVSGIEESCSLIVTLLIPEKSADRLKHIYFKCSDRFADLGVDGVRFDIRRPLDLNGFMWDRHKLEDDYAEQMSLKVAQNLLEIAEELDKSFIDQAQAMRHASIHEELTTYIRDSLAPRINEYLRESEQKQEKQTGFLVRFYDSIRRSVSYTLGYVSEFDVGGAFVYITRKIVQELEQATPQQAGVLKTELTMLLKDRFGVTLPEDQGQTQPSLVQSLPELPEVSDSLPTSTSPQNQSEGETLLLQFIRERAKEELEPPHSPQTQLTKGSEEAERNVSSDKDLPAQTPNLLGPQNDSQDEETKVGVIGRRLRFVGDDLGQKELEDSEKPKPSTANTQESKQPSFGAQVERPQNPRQDAQRRIGSVSKHRKL